MNAIKYDWEEMDDAPHSGFPTLVTDECHIEQVESVQHMHSISCTAVAAKVGVSSVCHQQLWEMRN